MSASRGPKVFLKGPRNLGGTAWDRDATKGFLSGVPLGLVGTRGILISDTRGGACVGDFLRAREWKWGENARLEGRRLLEWFLGG